MRTLLLSLAICAVLPVHLSLAQQAVTPSTQLLTVESNVKLEVLDFGGTGRPFVLLAGLGGTAHSWGSFATNLAGKYHVYAITRRGYGNSSAPAPSAENYNADRLGDDVLSVLDQLKIEPPILIGHSLAGEEMSSIESRHPERIAGLVYLDAGYAYALSPPDNGDFQIDTITLREHLDAILYALSAAQQKAAIESFERDLPALQNDVDRRMKDIAAAPALSPERLAQLESESKTEKNRIEYAIVFNERRYTQINCPVLAIFASPHNLTSNLKGDALAQAEAKDAAYSESRAKLFRALPNAKVVMLPHADHAVFYSNEGDVLREIDLFAATLH